MRRARIFLSLIGLVGFFFGSGRALGQYDQSFETGLLPYRSYQNGNIDTINIFNRGLNVDIPLISYPQRGGKLGLSFVLHYVNQGNWWDGSCENDVCSYTNSGIFPRNGFTVIQAGTAADNNNMCTEYEMIGTTEYMDCTDTLTLADGSSSSLAPTSGTAWRSADFEGYLLANYNPYENLGTPILTDDNGISYPQYVGYVGNPLPDPLQSYAYVVGPPPELEDTNGNEITFSGTQWTDTMGRTIPLPTSVSTSGCPQTPLAPVAAYTWNFPSLNGGTYSITFCYVSVATSISFDDGTYNSSMLQVQNVLLPNGTSWSFQFSTDGNSDLTQITFPTGGTLSYTWAPTGTVAEACVSHTYSNMRAVTSRTLNAHSADSSSGTWTYNSSSVEGVYSTVVTDPAGNDTSHTFTEPITNACPFYETKTQYYQGSHQTGTLQKTVSSTFTALPNDNIGWNTPEAQPTTANIQWANNQENQTTYSYDSALEFVAPLFVYGTGQLYSTGTYAWSYNLAQTQKDYDFGNGAPGSLLRTTATTYEALSNSNYLTNNLLNLPNEVTVTGAGPGSTTLYYYDQSTPVSSGISTQHNSSPPAGTYRGNQTEVSRYLNTGSTYLDTNTTVFDTGMPDVITDPNGNHTTSGYASTYVGAYLTSVKNALNQTTSYGYDFNTGLQTSITDPNNQTTNNTFDEMWRLTQVASPDGGKVGYTYNDTSPAPSVDIDITANSTGNPITGVELLDGLGRLQEKQLTSDAAGTDYTDYTYDAMGRTASVSNPYRGSPSNLLTTYSYDSLSRIKSVTEPDSSVQQTQFCGTSTLSIDEAGVWKRSITDGLGRTIEADEPTSSSSTANACAGQGGPVYATTYSYDVNGNLTGVTQAGSRQRTFAYDSLSRLTSSTNPEANTQPVNPYTAVPTTYSYDGDGNVLSKTSPAPNQQGTTTQTISYCYDGLNRMIQKSFTAQSCPMSSPAITYSYDNPSCGNSPYTCVNIGHRTGMTDAAGTESWIYALNKTASPEGLNITDQRTTSGVTKSSVYQLNYDGTIATLQYPSLNVVTYQYGAGNGHPSCAADANINYACQASYTADGQIAYYTMHLLLADTTHYNTRMQPCWSYVSTSAVTVSGCTASYPAGSYLDLRYNFNLGSDNGNLGAVTNDRDSTRSQTFTYDQASRIITGAGSTYAQSPSNCWGEQFGYDTTGNWGNVLSISPISSAYAGCTQESLNVGVNAYNRVTTFTYDTAGNLTTIPGTGGGSYTFSPENQIVSAGGVNYTYDGDNERVEKSSGKIYWYGIDGTLLDETDQTGSVTNSNFNEYVYFNGGRVARRDASNDAFYYLNDQIGSTRAIVEVPTGQDTGTLCFDTDYYPFGSQRNPVVSTCGTNYKFTGKELDPATESNLYNSSARFYASFEERFISPDPLGAPEADTSNPESWNFYSYVLNSPLSYTDSSGFGGDCPPNQEPVCKAPPNIWTGSVTSSWNEFTTIENFSFLKIKVKYSYTWTEETADGTGAIIHQYTAFVLVGQPSVLSTVEPQASWWSTFWRTFGNGILQGVRQPGQSFGACVLQNANTTTFGAHKALIAAVGTTASAAAVTASRVPLKVGSDTVSVSGAAYTALWAGRMVYTGSGGLISGTSVIRPVANAIAAAGRYGAPVAAAAEAGLLVGSAINCR